MKSFFKLFRNMPEKCKSESLLQAVAALRLLILKADAAKQPVAPSPPNKINPSAILNTYRIAFTYNLLNNSYIFCKIARRNGIDAFLLLEPTFAETTITSMPQWEDVDFQSSSMPKSTKSLPRWNCPEYILSSDWDIDIYNHIGTLFEYEKLCVALEGAPVDSPVGDPLKYLRYYSVLPHKGLLARFAPFDVLHVSGTHIGLASFTQKPYVVFPFGGDLFSLPFETTEIGNMQARGFYNASRVIASGKVFLPYLEALGIPASKIDMLPFMVDTTTYSPQDRDSSLREQICGEGNDSKCIFFMGARQNWFWKGNDKIFKAIAKIRKKTNNAIFVTSWYGQDCEKSSKLIDELNISDLVLKVGVMSKIRMRKYFSAVDVCIDQFTHGGLGTFSLESMSCGVPLITYYQANKHFDFPKEPPILNAFTEDEIAEKILFCIEKQNSLRLIGDSHRQWIINNHGCDKLWPQYDEVYKRAILEHRYSH